MAEMTKDKDDDDAIDFKTPPKLSRDQRRQLQTWARKVTEGQRASAVFCSLWSDGMRDDPGRDPIPVIQLGYAMLLDKPIVIVAPRGARVPENVKRAALAVEFYEPDDVLSVRAATLRAITVALGPGDS